MRATFFDEVIGQPRAIAALEAAASRPVHAYLFVGPHGTGKRHAALGFAAMLLCPEDPADPTCDTCRRVFAGVHPDVVSIERQGAAIGIDAARDVVTLSATSPVEGERKVVILHDFDLVREAAPALLKTIEEPAASTVFVILAEHIPPELVTIASRCVQVRFDPLSPTAISEALQADGISPERAAQLAEASGGRLDRARLLASDAEFERRRLAWQEIPGRLDGTGATASAIADELVAMLDSSVDPLRRRQATQMVELIERNERASQVAGSGKAGRAGARAAKTALNSGVREMEEQHRREQRRQRTDELRSGLAALAGAYGSRLAAAAAPAAGAADATRRSAAISAVAQIDRLSKDLEYNPGELLALQALLVRLGRIALRG